MTPLNTLKVGDPVIVHFPKWYNQRERIYDIARLTNTQILIERHSEIMKFHRKAGYLIPKSEIIDFYITPATEEDFKRITAINILEEKRREIKDADMDKITAEQIEKIHQILKENN